MAFVYGRIGDGKNVLARLHRANVIGDVFGGAKPIHAALARFKAEGRGVIVFLRDGTAGVPVAPSRTEGDTGSEAARTRQWREIGLGAQILKDLGISSIRLLASSKRTYVGLGGFGIEIVATEQAERPAFSPRPRAASQSGYGGDDRATRSLVYLPSPGCGWRAGLAWLAGLGRRPRRFADKSPSAVAVDVELVIAVDVSYSMDPDEQALQREGYIMGADLARIPAGAARRAPTARSPSPISNGPASSTRRSSCRGG